MAVVITKSTIIANRDSKPVVLTEPGVSGGAFKESMGSVASASGDSIGSTYLFTQVPSNAYVRVMNLFNDAVTAGALNVGVYYPTNKDGSSGAVINASFFAAAASVATANQSGSNIINQSGNNSLVNQQLPLWQALGLAQDPGGVLDIVGTLTASPTASGNIALRVAQTV